MRFWQQRLVTPGIVLGVALGAFGLFDASLSHGAPTAQITQAGDGIELEYTGEDGKSAKEVIPLYKVGSARYFSTGIGMEERTAQYPPFPLKLVFIAGAKAYVTQVAVTIKDTKGEMRLLIPDDQVKGPWLFVDLPASTYDITAVRRDRAEVTQRVEIVPGRTTVAYFRWKE